MFAAKILLAIVTVVVSYLPDPPAPTPTPAIVPGITFPILPPNVVPTPPPPPIPVEPVAVLQYGQMYVVQSDIQFFLLASPRNLVKIENDSGPIKIQGVFADGTGDYETRTYTSKFVATVTAVKGMGGRTELIAVPNGATSEDSIVRRLIDIGAAPQPPPPVPPTPDPVVPPVPVPSGFRVIVVVDAEANNDAYRTVINSPAIREYLDSHCVKGPNGWPEWRKWDPTTTIANTESKTMKALWEAIKPQLGKLPQIVIVTNDKGQVFDLPKTEADTLTLLKKFGGN